jgi:hypothetical protein
MNEGRNFCRESSHGLELNDRMLRLTPDAQTMHMLTRRYDESSHNSKGRNYRLVRDPTNYEEQIWGQVGTYRTPTLKENNYH